MDINVSLTILHDIVTDISETVTNKPPNMTPYDSIGAQKDPPNHETPKPSSRRPWKALRTARPTPPTFVGGLEEVRLFKGMPGRLRAVPEKARGFSLQAEV